MAREGRCSVCGEHLAGAARFCSGCGAPAQAAPLPLSTVDERGDAAGTSVVRDRSRWPVVVGVVAVAVFAAVLATSRMGETTSGAEIAPTTTSTSTESPANTRTPTVAPDTTTPPIDRVDVDDLPDELADTTLILLAAGRSAIALDLGTGDLTPFEIPGRSIRARDLLTVTPGGVLVSSPESDNARLLDWSFVEQIELPFVSAVAPAADGLWAQRPEPFNQLFRITSEGFPREVRTFDGPIELVGSLDGDALIASPRSSGVRRVGFDGSASLVDEVTAFQGGTDWLIGFACDADLRCARRLIDLRTGSTLETGLVDDDSLEIGRSPDGRRVIVGPATGVGPVVLIDADELAVTQLDIPERLLGPTSVDDELRYVFGPLAGVRVVSVETGDRWLIEINQIIRRVIVAPDQWQPPADGR